MIDNRDTSNPRNTTPHLPNIRPAAMTEPVCDPSTGVCELPSKNEKSAEPILPNISEIELLRLANVTTLLDDKGNSIKLESLPPTPLVLLYCSAVYPSII